MFIENQTTSADNFDLMITTIKLYVDQDMHIHDSQVYQKSERFIGFFCSPQTHAFT